VFLKWTLTSEPLAFVDLAEFAGFAEYISVINSCYPQEIVQFYSPNYAESLIQKLGDA